MGEADRRFHYRMVQISGNELLTKLTEGYRVLGLFVRANRKAGQVRDEHLEIVKAIEANRPAQAERLARRHVQAARQAVERQISQGTFVPNYVGRKVDGAATAGRGRDRQAQEKNDRKGKKS